MYRLLYQQKCVRQKLSEEGITQFIDHPIVNISTVLFFQPCSTSLHASDTEAEYAMKLHSEGFEFPSSLLFKLLQQFYW